jgi:dihydroorotate dehydrogenase
MGLIHDAAAKALGLIDAEDAHGLTIAALAAGLGPRDRQGDDPILAGAIGPLALPNALGLAAGFDKNAQASTAMLRAGFGLVECGTVTPLAQIGNPRPRLFRLRADQAVINRMGFNNEGLAPFAARLAARDKGAGLVGANIGANKDSQDRIGDYVIGLTRLWGLADYFTVNISSPNTPGLRALQTKAALDELLGRLGEARAALTQTLPRGAVPILLKVAPDLEDGEVESITACVQAHGLTGIIISNTTISRPASLTGAHRGEIGGLSGAPLLALSTEMLRRFHACAGGKLALIGAGGVSSGADAYAKIRAGACAVQIYSALAYQGPGLIGRIKTDLAAHLRADGFTRLEQAVGQA